MKELAPLTSKRATQDRVKSMKQALSVLEAGLAGKTPQLYQTEGKAIERLLRTIGVTLVSETEAARCGHVIKTGVKPCVSRYFGAPIKRYTNLYVFGVQTKPKPKTVRKPK